MLLTRTSTGQITSKVGYDTSARCSFIVHVRAISFEVDGKEACFARDDSAVTVAFVMGLVKLGVLASVRKDDYWCTV